MSSAVLVWTLLEAGSAVVRSYHTRGYDESYAVEDESESDDGSDESDAESQQNVQKTSSALAGSCTGQVLCNQQCDEAFELDEASSDEESDCVRLQHVIDKVAGRVNFVWIKLTKRQQMLDLGNHDIGRCRHGGAVGRLHCRGAAHRRWLPGVRQHTRRQTAS